MMMNMIMMIIIIIEISHILVCCNVFVDMYVSTFRRSVRLPSSRSLLSLKQLQVDVRTSYIRNFCARIQCQSTVWHVPKYLNFVGFAQRNPNSQSRALLHKPLNKQIYIYIYIYVCVCVYYLLQLSCHLVAVVLTLVQTEQIRINIHKRNITKTQYLQTHILPKPTHNKTHTYTQPHIIKPTHTHPHITKPPHTHIHTLQNTYTQPHITKPIHTHNHTL